jgi:hypothetical protein
VRLAQSPSGSVGAGGGIGFADVRTGERVSVAGIVFLVVVAIVVVAWAALVLLRGSKKVADKGADLTTGHQFPSEKGEAPSLLEDDLSFANRESDASRTDRTS